MKTIIKSLAILAACSAPMCLTSCLEEVQPTSGVTQEMLESSNKAGEAIVWGIPAFLNTYDLMGSSQAYDWGYPAIMHVRDVMTEDMAITSSSYDWFTAWEQCTNIGENYMRSQWIWYQLYQQIQTCNEAIKFYKQFPDNALYQGYLGVAYASRAAFMLDAARMFEFLPVSEDRVSSVNRKGNDVHGLTIPINTEETTEAQAKENPRAPHFADKCPTTGVYEKGYNLVYEGNVYHAMNEFIEADLNRAESLLASFARSGKTLPNIAVVYGLKSRLYMWDAEVYDSASEDYNDSAEQLASYAKASNYAQMAIQASGATPLTEDEWLNTASGFNDLSVSSWMWGGKLVEEDGAVQSGILNWTSWVSNETTYGYAAGGPTTMIGASVYAQITNSDFRKLSWVAPEGSSLAGKEKFVSPIFGHNGKNHLGEYVSLKFRPGMGNYSNFKIGSATAFPLMRVEEMWFNYIESEAHQSPTAAARLLEDFMKSYRTVKYSCKATSKDEIIQEIVFQKRVELWGEGQSYFDFKRLAMGVNRKYDDTNFYPACAFEVLGRPGWLNFVIVLSEGSNNTAVLDWNNPDPSAKYK